MTLLEKLLLEISTIRERNMVTSTPKKRKLFSDDFDSTFVAENVVSPLLPFKSETEEAVTTTITHLGERRKSKQGTPSWNEIKQTTPRLINRSLNSTFLQWVRESKVQSSKRQQIINKIAQERFKLVARSHLISHYMETYCEEMKKVKTEVVDKLFEFQAQRKQVRQEFDNWH